MPEELWLHHRVGYQSHGIVLLPPQILKLMFSLLVKAFVTMLNHCFHSFLQHLCEVMLIASLVYSGHSIFDYQNIVSCHNV